MADIAATILGSLLGASGGVAVIGFLAKKWVEARIQQSVKHEYDLKLEKAREAALVKAKAELVAELFAEWLSYSDDQRRLNQLTLEAFLWLPEDILHDLSNLLSHKPGSPGVRELIVRVRAHLLGSSSLPPNEVIIFVQESTKKMLERHKKEAALMTSVEAQQAVQADDPASSGSAA